LFEFEFVFVLMAMAMAIDADTGGGDLISLIVDTAEYRRIICSFVVVARY
jgi:hypothetical protein